MKKKKGQSKKPGNFVRGCVNCIKNKKCKDQPANRMRWYQEWCTKFDPNYRKIDRKRESHYPGANKLMKSIDAGEGVPFQRVAARLRDEVDGMIGRTEAAMGGEGSIE